MHPIRTSKLQEKLLSDPEWVARRKEREALLKRKRLAILEEQQAVLEELRHVGIVYNSLDEMLVSTRPYPRAISILLKHLTLEYSDPVKAVIARCLVIKEAISSWEFIVDAYERQPSQCNNCISQAKDGLAAAVAATFTPNRMDELIALISDKALGPTRVILLRHLRRRFRDPRIKAVL